MSSGNGAPKVLLVEDDHLVAEALRLQLEEAGYEVDQCRTGAEALVSLDRAAGAYGAVVTDIRMPGDVTGWEVARHARHLASAIPVIYMSGDSAADWAAEGVPRSVMLAKPFAGSQLIVALGNALNESDA
jgi:DNA-binding response OmpR family regulator